MLIASEPRGRRYGSRARELICMAKGAGGKAREEESVDGHMHFFISFVCVESYYERKGTCAK